METRFAILGILTALMLPACDESPPAATDGPVTKADSSTDTKPPLPDGSTKQRDLVIKSFVLPNTDAKAVQLGYDIDGDGKPDNAFGAILTAIHTAATGADMEAEINQNILNGNDVGLMRIAAKDFTNASDASFQGWTGQRETCCTAKPCKEPDVAKTCFSGTYAFKIDAASPKDATLTGTIKNGDLEFKGTITVELPIGMNRARVKLLAARFTGKLDASGISDGKIAGAVGQADIKNSVIPAVALTLDWEMKDPSTKQATKDAIKKVFDADGNGTITPPEVADNALVKAMLTGDVDADKDGKKEELSLGLGFRAVGCTISL